MSFYQVNQRRTFEREFRAGYLCCPNGNWAGWPLMKGLRVGDVLIHYNSVHGSVLGVSRVTKTGQHKGAASRNAHLIKGTQCIQYSGRHLSEADFSPSDQEHYRKKYPDYLEVHTAPLLEASLGKLLSRTPVAYLVPIRDEVAQDFLQKVDIRFEDGAHGE